MVSEYHRERARETMRANWQNAAFRARMEDLNKNRTHPTGERSSNWRGGEYKKKTGYVFVRVDGRYVQRSHVVWLAAHPGETILPGEAIHHVNHVKDDDRPENLRKIANGDHSKLHHKGRQWSDEHRAKAIESLKRAKRKYRIKSCGKYHAVCGECAGYIYGEAFREQQRRIKKERPIVYTPELRAKIAASVKASWERRRTTA